jgi:uncharacterized protein YeaO (DUF488 family)
MTEARASESSRRIRTKRVFDRRSPDDGWRVLVDRKWPLGVRKESAALDYWAKELAPSEELREFYRHDARRWLAFQMRLRDELRASTAALDTLASLAELAKAETVTLVFASREPVRNNATVVKEILQDYR